MQLKNETTTKTNETGVGFLGMTRATRSGLLGLMCGLAVLGMTQAPARADSEVVLYSFTVACGSEPNSSLVRDPAGNFYGTTQYGGRGAGNVYKLDTTGNCTALHNFTGGADGGTPYGGVIRDSAGNFYGTTTAGGAAGKGVVYGLDAAGHEKVLYNFCSLAGCADGSTPGVGVIRDAKGNLYGTTFYGGSANGGVVYKVDMAGQETVLYNFCSLPSCADGNIPGGMIPSPDGEFYGTTGSGGSGAENWGVVYKLDASGQETVLYNFCSLPGCSDGADPVGVVRDSAGNLYGTTSNGGGVDGVVFKLDTAGQETVLHTFTGGADGGVPYGGVILDSAGNLYGTTYYGGINPDCSGCGVVYEMDTAGRETVLYSFDDGSTGGHPIAGVIRDSKGNLYGTAPTAEGSLGVVFEIKPN